LFICTSAESFSLYAGFRFSFSLLFFFFFITGESCCTFFYFPRILSKILGPFFLRYVSCSPGPSVSWTPPLPEPLIATGQTSCPFYALPVTPIPLCFSHSLRPLTPHRARDSSRYLNGLLHVDFSVVFLETYFYSLFPFLGILFFSDQLPFRLFPLSQTLTLALSAGWSRIQISEFTPTIISPLLPFCIYMVPQFEPPFFDRL